MGLGRRERLSSIPSLTAVAILCSLHGTKLYFQGTYTLSRKIVRNRDVSSMHASACKKKLCPVL